MRSSALARTLSNHHQAGQTRPKPLGIRGYSCRFLDDGSKNAPVLLDFNRTLFVEIYDFSQLSEPFVVKAFRGNLKYRKALLNAPDLGYIGL